MAKKNSRQAIEVRGLRELRKALKDLGPDFQKKLRPAGKEASIVVAQKARDRAQSVGGVTAKAAPSIRNTTLASNLLGAGVIIDGEKVPYALGAEFGGGARPTTKQFPPWRGAGSDAGYAVYPTIRAEAGNIEEFFVMALDKALRENGLI